MGIILLLEHQAELWNIPAGVAETIIVVGNFVLRFLTTGPVAIAGAKTVAKAKSNIDTMAAKKGVS